MVPYYSSPEAAHNFSIDSSCQNISSRPPFHNDQTEREIPVKVDSSSQTIFSRNNINNIDFITENLARWLTNPETVALSDNDKKDISDMLNGIRIVCGAKKLESIWNEYSKLNQVF